MKYMLFVLALGLTACGDKSDDTGGKTGTSGPVIRSEGGHSA